MAAVECVGGAVNWLLDGVYGGGRSEAMVRLYRGRFTSGNSVMEYEGGG